MMLEVVRQDGSTIISSIASTKYDSSGTSFGQAGDDTIDGSDPMLLNIELPENETYYIRVRKQSVGTSGNYSLLAVLQGAAFDSSNGTLTINGTSQADDVEVSQSGDKTVIEMNGLIQEFVTSQVTKIIVNAGEGDDIVHFDPSMFVATVINGGAGNDRLTGGSGNDLINGGEGDDTLFAGIGNDLLSGNEGNDFLHGSSGDDILSGGTGNDSLMGSSGNDTLKGDEGNDKLVGGAGDDNLNGGEGDDNLFGTTESFPSEAGDILNGGAGTDYIDGVPE